MHRGGVGFENCTISTGSWHEPVRKGWWQADVRPGHHEPLLSWFVTQPGTKGVTYMPVCITKQDKRGLTFSPGWRHKPGLKVNFQTLPPLCIAISVL